jgi:hypothetical protein
MWCSRDRHAACSAHTAAKGTQSQRQPRRQEQPTEPVPGPPGREDESHRRDVRVPIASSMQVRGMTSFGPRSTASAPWYSRERPRRSGRHGMMTVRNGVHRGDWLPDWLPSREHTSEI